MALTYDVVRPTRGFTFHNPEVIATGQIYAGSYVAVGSEAHGTPAKIGRAYAFADEAGAIPIGFSEQNVLGAAAAGPLKTASVYVRGRVLESIPVTGLAGDYTDNFKYVYGSDDGTWTLTRTTVNNPIGITVNHISATLADVYFFSFAEMILMSAAGGVRRTWLFCSAPYSLLAHTTDVVKGLVAPCHGRILAIYAICTSAPADTNCVGKLQLEIGGTDVTGGIVALNFADTVGLKIAGTAVTAENVFHMGDLMDLEVIATDFVAGTNDDGHFNYFIDYECLPGM